MHTDIEEKNFYQQVGELIKSHRIRADKNHDALASHLGLSRSSIINIENGRQKILLHTLIDAAEFFNISVTELIPQKPQVNEAIDDEIISKISKKIWSDSQVSRFENFINLSSSKNQDND